MVRSIRSTRANWSLALSWWHHAPLATSHQWPVPRAGHLALTRVSPCDVKSVQIYRGQTGVDPGKLIERTHGQLAWQPASDFPIEINTINNAHQCTVTSQKGFIRSDNISSSQNQLLWVFCYQYVDFPLSLYVALDRSSWSLKSVIKDELKVEYNDPHKFASKLRSFPFMLRTNTVGHLWESKFWLP